MKILVSYRRLLTWLAPAIILSVLMGCASSPGQLTLNDSGDIASTVDTLLVVIDDPRSERRRLGFPGSGYSANFNYDSDPLLKRAASAVAKDHAVDILFQWPIKNLGVHCFVIETPDANTVSLLNADKRVRWTQPFNEFELQSGLPKAEKKQSFMQRFFNDVSERGDNVVIAVIDTGADMDHPDLQASNLVLRDFVGGADASIAEPHGTAVVGIIAANPNQKTPVPGLANDARVHLLRGCWQSQSGAGKCNTLTLARALDAALEINPQILNLSLTGPADRVLQELIKKISARGTLVIAAFDEQRNQQQRFPMPAPGVIYAYGIGADTQQHSNHSLDILYAPRDAISLTPMAGYDLVSGHSIATPQLAAMAACFIERDPSMERKQIVSALKQWLSSDNSI